MGTFSLVPNGNLEKTGDWTNVGGAGSNHAALADSSDSTYVKLNTAYSPTIGTQAILRLSFDASGATLPPGARVSKLYVTHRTKKTTSATPREFKTEIFGPYGGSLSSPQNRLVADSWQHEYTTHPITSIREAVATWTISTDRSGNLIPQSTINQLAVGIFYTHWTDILWYKTRLNIEYDEKPTVNITTPASGGAIENPSPLVTWEYSDDYQGQAAYQVKILDSSGTEVYDSGPVYSSDAFHQVKDILPNDTDYTVQVAVAQQWSGPGGEFWSDYDYSAFDITAPVPATPAITATAQTGYNELTVFHRLNQLSYESSNLESNIATWYAATADYTLANETTTFRSGAGALKVTTVGAAPTSYVYSEYIEIPDDATPMHFSVYARAGTGDGQTVRLQALFYDSAFSATENQTSDVAIVDTGWTELAFNYTPSTTGYKYVRIGVGMPNAASADIMYLDDALVLLGTDVPTIRDGGFFDQSVNKVGYSNWIMAGDMTWEANNGNTTVALSGTESYAGDSSLLLTTSSAADIAVQAKDVDYVQVSESGLDLSASAFRIAYAVHWPGTVKTATLYLYYWDKDLVLLGTDSVASSGSAGFANKWEVISELQGTPPEGTIYVSLEFKIATAATSTNYYVDAISLYLEDRQQVLTTGEHDRLGPYGVIEYSEDGGSTWSTLVAREIDKLAQSFVWRDYDYQHNVDRYYRARTTETIDSAYYASNYSESASASNTVSRVWIHGVEDPEGTAYQFIYDTGDRTENIDSGAQLTQFSGRDYPLAEWGEQQTRSFNVKLELPDDASIAAFRMLSFLKTHTILRDQRGRRYRGVIQNAQLQYEKYGMSAAFTFTVSGNQP